MVHLAAVQTALLALSLLPRADLDAEVAHWVGLGNLRGTIRIGVDLEVVRAPGWHVDIFTAAHSFVRPNAAHESPVRISPQQVWYPVGARLRFPMGADSEWGLFAFHQSNHDIDTDNPALNRETVAYEVYGAELVWPRLHLHGGLYYDRGTRTTGRPQVWPFDHYLAGLTAEGTLPLPHHLYGAGALTLIGHLDDSTQIPHLHVSGRLDFGAWWPGAAGHLRVFVRGQRVEDYQFLTDQPEHLLLLGVGMGSRLR